jgi:DNA-binding transcriptional LysR family regulator
MRATGVDLNLLAALDALLVERHVTRAGRRVGLSQPAMSEALARLRRHFGDDLLIRVGNRYELTPLGASLRASSGAAMELVEQTFTAGQDFDPRTCEREFVMLASDYAASLLGPHLIAAMRREAPRARLRLGQLPTVEPACAMSAGVQGIDGFLLPQGGSVEGFAGVTLFRDRWVCLLSADNPAVTRPLTLDALGTMPWVVHEVAGRSGPVLGRLRAHGVKLDVEVVVSDFNLLPDMIRGSGRIGVVQERLIARSGPGPELRVLELPFEAAPIVETLWWHPAHTRNPSHRWFRELVVAAGRQVGGEPDDAPDARR